MFCTQTLWMILSIFPVQIRFFAKSERRPMFLRKYGNPPCFSKTIAYLGIKNPRLKRGHLLEIHLALAAADLFRTENQIVHIQPTAVCHIRRRLLSSLFRGEV